MKAASCPLEIDVRRICHHHQTVSVLRFIGPITSDTARSVREKTEPVIDQTQDSVVLVLDSVHTLDSTGLMVVTRMLARLRRDRRQMVLCTTNPRILALLRLTGLRKLFMVRPNLEEALDAAAPG